ncbi:hypothetical protein KIN20_035335 [Parelaphostrongylus tenuis]|uniref:Uncharacterized protein n=1 Tax=Parelaphostrongylus tenuis TaxID=148309 RepID=A0AAD5RBL4_PARTN|nr:hypothetical protein KIN20_035335 [Parelaphostrongylus tenuis]
MSRVHGVVLVTGSNRGIGLEMTRSLLCNENVSRVYAGCRNRDKFEMLRSLPDPQRKLRILELDVSRDSSIKSALETVERESKHLNLLINNAAILEKDHKAGIIGGERSSWLRHFDVNVISYAMMAQEFLPLLREALTNNESATILNISGRKGSIELCPGAERLHGNYAYMCSKTAVNHLTRLLSIEYPDILTVAMCPGWNRTDMGGPEGMSDPSESAPMLLDTVDGMTIANHSGKYLDRKGQIIPY